jgi:hypothetical protein
MKKVCFIAAILALLISCSKEVQQKSLNSSLSQNSNVQYVSHQTITKDDISFDGCTGELIHETGSIDFVVKFTFDPLTNKETYVVEEHGVNLMAVGLQSGLKYQTTFHLTNNFTATWNGSSLDSHTENITIREIWTSPLGNNLVSTFTQHIILQADASIVVNSSSSIYGCI